MTAGLMLICACGDDPPAAVRPPSSDPWTVAEAALRETGRILRLGATRLNEVAPEYVADGPTDLTWEQAMDHARQRWPENRAKRACYMRKFLVWGDPCSHLLDLELMDTGIRQMHGRGVSQSLVIDGWIEYDDAPSRDQSSVVGRTSHARATLSFGASEFDLKKAKLWSEVSLNLRDRDLPQGFAADVSFDRGDALTSFGRTLSLDGIRIHVGGNLSGEGGTANYWIQMGELESRNYGPGFALRERTVFDPISHEALYLEVHEPDGSVRRVDTKP